MSILFRKSLANQPSYPAGVNYANPISKGLLIAQLGNGYIWNSGKWSKFGPASVPTLNGWAQGSVSFYSVAIKKPLVDTSKPYTIFILSKHNLQGQGYPVAGATNGSGPSSALDITTSATNVPTFNFYMNNAQQAIAADSAVSVGSTFSFAGVNTGSVQSAYLNGKKQSTTTAFSGGGLGGWNNWAMYAPSDLIVCALFFNRALSSIELSSLSANPWQLFQSIRPTFLNSITSGGTTFNQSVSGTSALHAFMVRQATHKVMGTVPVLATNQRQTARSIRGTSGLMGKIIRLTSRSLSSTTGALANIKRSITHRMLGASQTLAFMKRSTLRTIHSTVGLFANVKRIISRKVTTTAGNIASLVATHVLMRTLLGLVGNAAKMNRIPVKLLHAIIPVVVSTLRKINRTVLGLVSTVAVLHKRIGRTLRGSVGMLGKLMHGFIKVLKAAAGLVGHLVKVSHRVVLVKAIVGMVAVLRASKHLLRAVVGTASKVIKQIHKTLFAR